MPPLRFLHAAGLDPDAVLPSPPAGLADIFASAPIAAVRRLVTRAVELEVDFLLLTSGGSQSPSAENALRREFDRLIEHGITVFFTVGSRDSGWERLVGRGSNVVLLAPGSFAPVSDRDGRPVGILRCVDRPIIAEHPAPPGPEDSLELAVAPRLSAVDIADVVAIRHDYLALGRGSRNTLSLSGGFAHAAGPIQAIEASETGPQGATLVTVEADGKVRTEFISTAAIRFERQEVAAERRDVVEDVAIRMAERLSGMRVEPGEAAWVVCWQVSGVGQLGEVLSEPSGRSDLVGLLPDKIGDVSIAHQIVLQSASLRAVTHGGFAAEFENALQECEASLGSAAASLALVGIAQDAPHRDRLGRLLAAADTTRVIGIARRLGLAVAAAANGSDD
jgi:hypothetical protein